MGHSVVGSSELMSAAWYLDGTEVTTGTATLQLQVSVAGVLNYLQSDLLTLSSTPASLSLTYGATQKWHRFLTMPSSMANVNVYAVYTHSNVLLPPIVEDIFVENVSIDPDGASVTE